jgi:hypothetical protein
VAGEGWGPEANPLLSGLFGAFRSNAAEYASTSDIWTALRVNAATWQWQAQGGGELPSVDELEATGAQILSAQGVTIQGVNAYRAIAGQARSAHDALLALDRDRQLTAEHIFVPPWAKTTDSSVPSRYRIRVQWQVTPAAGDIFTKWSTYEVSTPLTTVNAILDEAGQLAKTVPTSDQIAAAVNLEANDYELEQI